ncbi:MAG: hypothetical protein R3277_13185, partial [Brumimicrobium sp.]|nr:hypothetical protein [Brumimicrobium sp.]
MEELKKQAIIKMKAILSEKQSDLHQSLIDLKESRESDTKSSAGDKYETGREMINQEMDAVQTRLDQVKLLLNEVDNLPVKGNLGAVSTGSLVKTNRGLYLIGPGLGKITIDNE